MLEELIQLDQELFLFLNNLGNDSWDGFWLGATNKWSSIPVYFILLLLTFKYFGTKRTLVILVIVALLITCTDQLANFFKYGVQRLRPCYEEGISESMRLVKRSCGGKFSYFSAHAANSFAAASFFAFLLRSKIRPIPAILMIWALIIAYSRIYIGVHYPLDILSGAVVGLLFGWLFFRLHIFVENKFAL